jgi:hypothetical protein
VAREQVPRHDARLTARGVPQRLVDLVGKRLWRHIHRRGHVKPDEIVALLERAGFQVVESGPVGISSLQYVLAVVVG